MSFSWIGLDGWERFLGDYEEKERKIVYLDGVLMVIRGGLFIKLVLGRRKRVVMG